MTETAATDTGFIGPIGPGCEFSGTQSAPLAPPLTAGDVMGSVDFVDGALDAIIVAAGAGTEEGFNVGDTLATLASAYASSSTIDVDRSVEGVFGIWVATVTLGDGGTYDMVIDPTETVTNIAVPAVPFCD